MTNNKLKTTLWLLAVAVLIDMQVVNLLQNMIISYINIYHITFWSYDITTIPCKNKLDVIYFVVANFTWLLWATSKNRSYLRKATTVIIKLPFNLLQGLPSSN